MQQTSADHGFFIHFDTEFRGQKQCHMCHIDTMLTYRCGTVLHKLFHIVKLRILVLGSFPDHPLHQLSFFLRQFFHLPGDSAHFYLLLYILYRTIIYYNP